MKHNATICTTICTAVILSRFFTIHGKFVEITENLNFYRQEKISYREKHFGNAHSLPNAEN
jgi:hypothetical protein